MQELVRLEDQVWADGNTVLVDLDALPANKRVRKIECLFKLTGTKDEADEVPADAFALAVAGMRLGNYVNVPGWNLDCLMQSVFGRIIYRGAAVPGSGTTFTAYFPLVIPFSDFRQPGSDDGGMPTELLMSRALEIDFAAAAIYGVGSVAITAGNVRILAEIVAGSAVPQLNVIGYEDPGALTMPLRPGVYKDLLLTDGVGKGTITEAEVASVDLEVDGRRVHNNIRHDQMVNSYNVEYPDAAGQIVVNAARYLPLIWTPWNGKGLISKQPVTEKRGQAQLTGTLTAPRLTFWKTIQKAASDVVQVAKDIRAPANAVGYRPALATKTPLIPGAGVKARVLNSALAGKFRQGLLKPSGIGGKGVPWNTGLSPAEMRARNRR
ncbi:MAG: hypothetical protein KAT00_04925 [Planctomycetes bacterium]|nr:hypothetical protein [Planctomycetota bacterium]